MDLIVYLTGHTNKKFRYSDHTSLVGYILKRKMPAKKSCILPNKSSVGGGVTGTVIQE